ncbi:MAG: SH3 domain-containing protein [Oscillospiraceae bacterium]
MKQCRILTSLAVTTLLCPILSMSISATTEPLAADALHTQANQRLVRQMPSVLSTPLSQGGAVTFLQQNGSWWMDGFAHGDYISPLAGSDLAAVKTASGEVDIRSGPSAGYPVIGSIKDGDTIAVISQARGWSRIVYAGVKSGYISSAYLAGAPGGVSTDGTVRLSVPLYKQYDRRWANVRLNTEGETVRQIGCATACLAMTESYRTGKTLTPLTMSQRLYYSARGDLAWPPQYRAYTGTDYLRVIREQLQKGIPVMFGAKTASGKSHWVVVTGMRGASASAMMINDPGSDERETLQHLLNEYPIFYKLEYADR